MHTPTMMLGRTPRFSAALPAGHLGAASFPGSGGPNVMTEVGRFPDLNNNFITNPPGVPPTPGNPGRVFNGGYPLPPSSPTGSSVGLPISGMVVAGLAATPRRTLVRPSAGMRTSFTMGVLGIGLGALPGAEDSRSTLEEVAQMRPADLEPCLQRIGSGATSMTYAQFWQGRAATLHLLGAVVGGVHGYRRNKGAFGWSLGWAALGFFFPVITTGVALYQGLSKKG